jgi:putative ABC transport system permease protein
VIANPAPGLFTGLTATADTFSGFEDTSRGHALLLSTRPGVDAERFAHDLSKAKYKRGVTAQTLRGLLETGYAATRTFFSIIDVLMKMGLVVGILSLGILSLRAIVERRHLIGVMRAIGYRKHSVLSGLLIESAAIATLGVLVGSAVGIGMAWIFYSIFFEESVFGVQWSSLFGALGLVYAATFLVTIGPAWRASRLPPAEAVRYVE